MGTRALIGLTAGLTLGLIHSPLMAETTLRLSTYVNEVDVRHEGFKKFAELVEQKTEGRVKVEVFPSATPN